MAVAIMASISIVSGTAGLAQAMSPPQTSASGVVSTLGSKAAGGIQDFWSFSFRSWGEDYNKPELYFYGKGVYMRRVCGSKAERQLKNAFYCPAEHAIYMDRNWFDRLVDKNGDFSVGGILAHEWGHAVSGLLGYGVHDFREEYHADCLAGMYVRYGYDSGRLTGRDYDEYRNMYLRMAYSDSHGYGKTRAKWFDFGHDEYSLAACDLAFDLTKPLKGDAAPRTQKEGTVADVIR